MGIVSSQIFRSIKSSHIYSYFSVRLKSSNVTILVFYEERSLGIRDSHVIKLMRKDWKELISLPSCEPFLTAAIFSFLKIPRTNFEMFGDGAFTRSGPFLWNKLPLKFETAKVKPFLSPTLALFNLAYYLF